MTIVTLLIGDGLSILALVGGAFQVAAWIAPESHGETFFVLLAGVPLLTITFCVAGFYRPTFTHPACEMKRVALTVAIVTGTATFVWSLATRDFTTALVIGGTGLVGTILLPFCRVLTRILWSQFSWWGVPAVILSSGESGKNVLNTLDRWPEIGLRPVALLSEASDPEGYNFELGGADWAPFLARRFDVPYAVISAPDLSYARRAKLSARYAKFFDHVFVVTWAGKLPALWKTGEPGEALQGYGVHNAASGAWMWVVKRAVDLIGASVGLLLLAPVFAAIALLIRMDSEGAIFFTQKRIGTDRRIFTAYKFRTMYPDADERLADVLEANPDRRREYEQYHKLENDPRETDVGKFLRQYSLDELPQLLNVLRGEMSLVGPRAYMPSELPDMEGLESVILQTPPGVTGLWQVSGRNNLSFSTRVRLDVHYVQNWTLWLDIYLLIRTLPALVTKEGVT